MKEKAGEGRVGFLSFFLSCAVSRTLKEKGKKQRRILVDEDFDGLMSFRKEIFPVFLCDFLFGSVFMSTWKMRPYLKSKTEDIALAGNAFGVGVLLQIMDKGSTERRDGLWKVLLTECWLNM